MYYFILSFLFLFLFAKIILFAWTKLGVDNMIRDIGEENFHQAHVYDYLKDGSLIEMYPGCSSFSRLLAVLRLFNMKARNGWTDRSVTELLEFLHEILPKGNTLPTSHYEAKKILCPMGLEYRKYMFVQMIVYYIENNLNDCISVPDAGYQDTK